MRSAKLLVTIALGAVLLAGAGQPEPEAALHDRAQENWPMYGRNLRHSFSNPQSRINPGNVASLRQVWAFPTGDAVSASPTVVNGVVYVGSWDGYFYALEAKTGKLIWKFQVDCQNTIVPVPPHCLAPGEAPPPRFFTDGGLITSTAAVVRGRIYFAAGKTVYSLNARDGSLRWKYVICGNPEAPNCAADPQDSTQIFSSPAIFAGLLFIGHTVDSEGYRGAIEALDTEDGTQRWRFEVDPILDATGQPARDEDSRAAGGYNRGCGNVWSSAAVDPGSNLVFFTTADCNREAVGPYHEAILALEADTGTARWAYRPPRHDPACDFDFGATPNLIDVAGRHYLGVGGKDGTYYLLRRRSAKPQGDLVWATNVVFGGSSGGFFGASFEDGRIFAATMLGDGNIFEQTGLCAPIDPRDTFLQEPSMHALGIADGRVLWQSTQNHSAAPTSLAAGVVFSGLIGIEGFGLNAYDARTGELLVRLPMSSSVNSAATPVGEMLFVTSGNPSDGSGSGVTAFALP